MANLAFPRSAVAEIGGKHLHDHNLMYESPVGVRNSDQRYSSDNVPPRGATHTDGHGSGQSTSEEATNEDDDEDSSASKEDDQEDEGDDPEVLAPSHARGLGKGKRPAIHIEVAGEDESQEDEEVVSRETGLKTKNSVNLLLTPSKKRTYSNVSNTSILFGEDDIENRAFPRTKVARQLSSNSSRPLLIYNGKAAHDDVNGYDENAIESSDDEKEPDADDEDYSGLQFISDESDIEQQEEAFIKNDATKDARRLSIDSTTSDNLFDFHFPADGSFIGGSLPDLGFSQFFEPDPISVSPEPSANRKYSTSSTKRVRFDDEVEASDSSSSSTSDLDSGLWPDLFLEQDKLPPSLYQLIEADNDTDNVDYYSPSGSDQSYWDVGQDDGRATLLPAMEDSDDNGSDAGSSGYETDMGDTTDEDSDYASDAPPQTPHQKSVLRRPSSTPGSRAVSPKPFARSHQPNSTGRVVIPPLRGIFIHGESSQAIAVTNRATKALTFYRPRAAGSLRQPNYTTYSSSTSTANNSPRTSVQQFNVSDSEMSNDPFINPFGSTTDIMLTGIFGSAPASNYLFSGQSIGPPEAFYPFVNITQNGNILDDADEYDDDEDFEDDINIEDFMEFGNDIDATDLEQDEETDVPATPATSMIAFSGSTPAQPTPMTETPLNRKRNVSDAMLEHFDRGVVTAFRNNQNRYRDLACLPPDPDLRASVSRPVRSGRSAEALMSPLRKRSTNHRKHGSSSFAGVTKATGRLQSSVMSSRRGPQMGTFS